MYYDLTAELVVVTISGCMTKRMVKLSYIYTSRYVITSLAKGMNWKRVGENLYRWFFYYQYKSSLGAKVYCCWKWNKVLQGGGSISVERNCANDILSPPVINKDDLRRGRIYISREIRVDQYGFAPGEKKTGGDSVLAHRVKIQNTDRGRGESKEGKGES